VLPLSRLAADERQGTHLALPPGMRMCIGLLILSFVAGLVG
jgi:hypothetical protein